MIFNRETVDGLRTQIELLKHETDHTDTLYVLTAILLLIEDWREMQTRIAVNESVAKESLLRTTPSPYTTASHPIPSVFGAPVPPGVSIVQVERDITRRQTIVKYSNGTIRAFSDALLASSKFEPVTTTIGDTLENTSGPVC